MNHNLRLSLMALLLAVFLSSAQNVKIEWGGDFTNRWSSKLPDFYGKSGKELRALYYNTREKTYFVTRYNYQSLTKLDDVPVFGKEVDRKSDKFEDQDFIGYKGVKEDLYIFSVLYDKKNDVSTLYCTKVDKNLKAGEPQIIDQINAEKKREAFAYNIYLSTDSSMFVIMKAPDVGKNDNVVYFFKTIDVKTLKVLNNFNYTMPSAEKNTSFSDLLINKDGTIFLLAIVKNVDAKEKNKKKSKEEKIEKYSYRLITANPKKKYETKDFNISILGKDLIELKLRHNPLTGMIYGLAYYSDLKASGKAKGGINGMAYLAIDEEKVDLEKSFFKDFPANIVEELEGGRAVRKNQGIDGSFEIKAVLTKDNGGLYFVLEDEYIVTTTTYNSSTKTYETHYYYHNEDVLVASFSPTGGIEWYCIIPKHQVTRDDGGYRNSIYAHAINDKLHIVFNGSKKIIEENDVSKSMNISSQKKSAIIDVIIDKSGKYQIAEIENKVGKNTYVVLPKFADKIGKNEAVIIGLKNLKNKCLVAMCTCGGLFRKKKADDKKLARLTFN